MTFWTCTFKKKSFFAIWRQSSYPASLATSTLRFPPPWSLHFCLYFPFDQCFQPNSNLSVSFCRTFDRPPLLSFVLALLPHLFSLRIFFTLSIFSCRSKSGLRLAALVEEDGSGEQKNPLSLSLSPIVSTPKEEAVRHHKDSRFVHLYPRKKHQMLSKGQKKLKYSLKINWEWSFMYSREVPWWTW